MGILRTRMEQDLVLRGRSEHTRRAYLRAVADLARYHHRSPDQLRDRVQQYLRYLIDERCLAWASCRQTVGALRFFYEVTLGRPRRDFSIPLPKAAKRPGTRRHYAQLINRVLALAVYPCRHIAANPLPRGFMPKVGKPPAYPFLYPDEDRKLMAQTTVPLAYRVLYGFLAREGMRVSEALGLQFSHLDLERGAVSLDKNKTDDPRTWALDPGVVEALRDWKRRHPDDEPGDHLFREIWKPYLLPEILRDHLKVAGVTRAELFERSAARRPIRVHDLRATMITTWLAAGSALSSCCRRSSTRTWCCASTSARRGTSSHSRRRRRSTT